MEAISDISRILGRFQHALEHLVAAKRKTQPTVASTILDAAAPLCLQGMLVGAGRSNRP
jgi:hypothetical protein